jgi:hypothetical protein
MGAHNEPQPITSILDRIESGFSFAISVSTRQWNASRYTYRLLNMNIKPVLFALFLGISANAVGGTRVVTSDVKLGTNKPEACKAAIDSMKFEYQEIISVDCNCENNSNKFFPWKCVAIFMVKN